MPAIIFDIETGPLPDDQLLRAVEPFPELSPYPDLQPFDPASVKCGNLKDEAKIKEKIEAARASHETDYAAAKANHLAEYERNRATYYGTVKERAALAAETGQVLAIGYANSDSIKQSADCSLVMVDGQVNGEAQSAAHPNAAEIELLGRFWNRYQQCVNKGVPMVGFNTQGFDLPFLIRRSWLLGVPVPGGILDKGRYWNPLLIDLLANWKCGQFGGSGANGSISLDRLSRALGLPGKNGNGADFARLWKEDRAVAVDYLQNDVLLTAKVAMALGVC